MARTALCDTGFWIGLFDGTDSHSRDSGEIFQLLTEGKYSIVTPWPVLYEFLNSRFFRKDDWIPKFQKIDKGGYIEKISDESYREAAFENVFVESRTYRDVSLVDSVIREMLKDVQFKIAVLVTYDSGFLHLCQSRGVQLFP